MRSFAATRCTFHAETLLEPDKFIRLDHCRYEGDAAQRWSQRYLGDSIRGWTDLHAQDEPEAIMRVILPWNGRMAPVPFNYDDPAPQVIFLFNRWLAIYGAWLDTTTAKPTVLIGVLTESIIAPGRTLGLFTPDGDSIGNMLGCGRHIEPSIVMDNEDLLLGCRRVMYVQVDGIS